MRFLPPFLATLVVFNFLKTVNSANILFIAAISSKSQKNFMDGVAFSLAEDGHKVTMVSPFKRKEPVKNLDDIVLEDLDFTPWMENCFENDGNLMVLADKASTECTNAMIRLDADGLFKKSFDLLIVKASYCDCFMSLSHTLKIPMISVNSIGPFGMVNNRLGIPSFPSFMPNLFVGYKSHPLPFYTRTLNLLMDLMAEIYVDYFYYKDIEHACREAKMCPEDMPSISTLSYNFSLTIVNSIRVLEYPSQPATTSLVYGGGIHCRPSKPLPKDLEDFISSSGEDGFIFFSMGSIITPSHIPKQYLKILLKVLGSLKQKVIWKWDQEVLEGAPSNVLIKKWLPQQDILGHPKIRLFISHGGLLSTVEAIYHGAPVLALPVFLDQEHNGRDLEGRNTGTYLKWSDMTEESLSNKINFLLNDEQLNKNVKVQSEMVKNWPNSPKKEIQFWINHILKHGSDRLRSPVRDMYWYQIYNVDVWILLITLSTVLLALIYGIIRFTLRFIVTWTLLCFGKVYVNFLLVKFKKGQKKD